jgi:hypothetical protein
MALPCSLRYRLSPVVLNAHFADMPHLAAVNDGVSMEAVDAFAVPKRPRLAQLEGFLTPGLAALAQDSLAL